MRAAEAALLGLIHGPAELLPISSSAHIALLTHTREDQAMAVALHAGTALALLDRVRRRPELLVPAGAVTLAAALMFERSAERKLGSPGALAAGMLAGAAALAAADRAPQARRATTWADGLALGLAQAAALWPGVSRNGATLAAGRARGLDRATAQEASFAVGVPTLLGAAAVKARGVRPSRAHAAGAAGAFASTLAARPLLGLAARGPLWPFAAYRVPVALALLRRSAA